MSPKADDACQAIKRKATNSNYSINKRRTKKKKTKMIKSWRTNFIMMKKLDKKYLLLSYSVKKESIHLRTELYTVGNGLEGIDTDTESRLGQMARNTKANG